MLGVLALVILLIVVGLVYVRGQINPGGKRGPTVVVIPVRSSSSQIGTLLAKAKIIHDGGLFAYYAKLSGAGSLLPGSYKLATNESYGDVVNTLEAGPVKVVDKLVVPEGYSLADIAPRVGALPNLHLTAAKFLAASSGTVRSPYEPPGVNNLEGLVFPATYAINSDETEVDVMEQMVTAFNQKAQTVDLVAGAARLHMTPYDMVKVASIVEGEAKLDRDRGPVASAIYNRLTQGMTLGADSTLVYALRKANPAVNSATIDYNQPNPFNTRLNKGLPPDADRQPGCAVADGRRPSRRRPPTCTSWRSTPTASSASPPPTPASRASRSSAGRPSSAEQFSGMAGAPTAATSVLGVIGDPVHRSLSPVLHNAALAELGLDWVYVAFPVAAGDGRRSTPPGCSASPASRSPCPTSRRDRRPRPGQPDRPPPGGGQHRHGPAGTMIGDNTDGAGLVDALRSEEGWDPSGRRCAVLGTGGAARAVTLGLAGRSGRGRRGGSQPRGDHGRRGARRVGAGWG